MLRYIAIYQQYAIHNYINTFYQAHCNCIVLYCNIVASLPQMPNLCKQSIVHLHYCGDYEFRG